MRLLYLSALALLLSSTAKSDNGNKKNVLLCYFAEWSVWRTAGGKFYANNIDPHLCDIIVYSYTGLNASTNEITSRAPNTDYKLNGTGLIAEVVAMKNRNPDLKVMVSCGGWSEGSLKFSAMAASRPKRHTFIQSVVEYLKLHKFDGLDMAWEYPSDRGGSPDDRENFATLLEELREEFDKHGFLLTAQLMAKRYIVPGYDVPRISNAVHYISLVAYQYHFPGERITGHNAPLHSDDDLNVEYSVNYMLKEGADRDKILLGFSTYGHQFIMDRPVEDDNYIGVPASKTYPSPWSHESGFIGFNEVCYDLTAGTSWQEHWDDNASVPFAVQGDKFVSYQNRRSYLKKLDLLKDKGLGGAMVWSIDTDDFKGICYKIKYPLIGVIKEYLRTLQNKGGDEGSGNGDDLNSSVSTEQTTF